MNEPHRSVVVDRVNWGDILLISRIPRALALSLQPSRIVLGFILVVIIMASGAIWDGIFGKVVGPAGLGSPRPSHEVVVTSLAPILADPSLVRSDLASPLREAAEALTPGQVRSALLATYRATPEEERSRQAVEAALAQVRLVSSKGVFEATGEAVVERVHGLLHAATQFDLSGVGYELAGFVQIGGVLFEEHVAFAIVFGVWLLVVGMIGLATLSRTAACQFALEQYLPWTTALAFALKRWIPIVGTLVLPLIALALGAIALALGGLFLAVPGLNIIAGVLYGLALFGGAIAAFLILLTLFASALFVPAVAVESADAPDALARGFSFVRNRPLHWIVYGIAAFVQGLFGLFLVTLLAAVAINFTAWGAGLFISAPAIEALGGSAGMYDILPSNDGWELGGTHRITGGILVLWRTVAGGLVAGWVISYFACATTVLYFLMRKATDDQDLEEIWQPGLIEGTMAPGRASVIDGGQEA